jgi:hypothetical protein
MSEPHGTYFIEFVTVGNQVKVTALDPRTGKEAVVICPESATQKEMSDLAVKKLEYLLRKNCNE